MSEASYNHLMPDDPPQRPVGLETPTPEALARMAAVLEARWEHIANTEAISGYLSRAWFQLADAALTGQTHAECHPAALCDGPDQSREIERLTEMLRVANECTELELTRVAAERDALRSYILQSGGSNGLLEWIATHGVDRVERLERVAAAAREHRHGGCTVGHHELDDSLAALRARPAALETP